MLGFCSRGISKVDGAEIMVKKDHIWENSANLQQLNTVV
jgi:hypothetical protein